MSTTQITDAAAQAQTNASDLSSDASMATNSTELVLCTSGAEPVDQQPSLHIAKVCTHSSANASTNMITASSAIRGRFSSVFHELLQIPSQTLRELNFQLPGEVRNLIYEHLLTDVSETFSVQEDRRKTMSWITGKTDSEKQPLLVRLSGLNLAKSHAFYEITSIFIGRSSFVVSGSADIIHLESFLLMLPSVHGFAKVRKMSLPHFSEHVTSRSRAEEAMTFCTQFYNLRELDITIRAETFLESIPLFEDGEFVSSERPPRVAPLHQVVANLDLTKLTQMSSLTNLTLICDSCCVYHKLACELVWDIGLWVADEFTAQPDVEEVVYHRTFDEGNAKASFSMSIRRR